MIPSHCDYNLLAGVNTWKMGVEWETESVRQVGVGVGPSSG